MEGFHPSHLSTMLSRFRFLQYAGRLSHKKLAVKAYHGFSRVQILVGGSESFLSNPARDVMNISRYISQLLLLFAFWSQLKEILSRKCNCKQSKPLAPTAFQN